MIDIECPERSTSFELTSQERWIEATQMDYWILDFKEVNNNLFIKTKLKFDDLVLC